MNVTSAVADCDSCYQEHTGTSMASPHIAGYVANLLWVDPTLKLYEIKSLLMRNTTTVGECMFFFLFVCFLSLLKCCMISRHFCFVK